MKKIILIVALISSTFCFSQNKNSGFKQPFPVFEDCEKSDSPNKCFNSIIISNIIPAIENEIKNYLSLDADYESVLVYINFIIGEDGNPIKESINVSKFKKSPSIESKLKGVVLNLPDISPKRNEYNYPILSYYHLSLDLGLDKENNIVLLEELNEPKAFTNNENFKAPIYPGCSENLSNTNRKKCFSNQMTKLIVKKFKLNRALNGFKKRGTFYTFVLFTVNKSGEINQYYVFGPSVNVEKEALRSLKKVKELTPATHYNKPVNVTFAIPIKFKI